MSGDGYSRLANDISLSLVDVSVITAINDFHVDSLISKASLVYVCCNDLDTRCSAHCTVESLTTDNQGIARTPIPDAALRRITRSLNIKFHGLRTLQ